MRWVLVRSFYAFAAGVSILCLFTLPSGPSLSLFRKWYFESGFCQLFWGQIKRAFSFPLREMLISKVGNTVQDKNWPLFEWENNSADSAFISSVQKIFTFKITTWIGFCIATFFLWSLKVDKGKEFRKKSDDIFSEKEALLNFSKFRLSQWQTLFFLFPVNFRCIDLRHEIKIDCCQKSCLS